MGAPLEYKPLVRFRNDGAPSLRRERMSPLAVPVAAYWLGSAALIYGMSSGEIPLERWLRAEHAAAPAAATRTVRRTESLVPSLPTSPVHETSAAKIAVSDEPRTTSAPANDFVEPAASERQRTDMPTSESSRVDSPEPSWRAPANERLRPTEDSDGETEPARPSAPLDADEAVSAPSIGVSCESVISTYQEELDLGKRQRMPDLPRSAFASVLDDGRYMVPCHVPDEMTVEICAAVQSGRAVGVTVVTHPTNDRVRGCVANAVRGLSFPKSEKLDVTHTRFAPVP